MALIDIHGIFKNNMDNRNVGCQKIFLLISFISTILLLTMVLKIANDTYKPTGLKTPQPASTPLPLLKSNLKSTLNPRATVCPTTFKPGVYSMNQNKNRTKIVLFWNRPSDWNLNFDKCEYKDCVITYDKCNFPRSDAVLYNTRSLFVKYVPKRVPGQIFVYMTHEPPERMQVSYKNKKWHNFFNWTWSYRRDADISAPYGQIFPIKQDNFSKINFSALFHSKTKTAAIFVSHCKTESKREQYVKLMQKYLNVDVYGNCGPLKCPRSKHVYCRKNLQENYKFYLSFENSLCQDYVTEKLLHIVYDLVVPVVRGDKYVHMYMPPKSYIDTRDFSSARELTYYLLKISSSQSEYEEYYNWRRHYKSHHDSVYGLCKLCKMLHNVDKHKSVYKDIHAWSTKIEDKPICITKPKDLH